MNARRKPTDDSVITSPLAATLISTDAGLIPIERVRPGMMIRTAAGLRRVVAQRMRAATSMVMIRLANGIEMRLPHDLQLRSVNGWITAGELRRDMPVYMSTTAGRFGEQRDLSLQYTNYFYVENLPTLPTVWSVELAGLVGYFIAKGFLN